MSCHGVPRKFRFLSGLPRRLVKRRVDTLVRQAVSAAASVTSPVVVLVAQREHLVAQKRRA